MHNGFDLAELVYIYSKLLRKTRHADIIRGDFSLIKTYRNFM